MFPISNGPHIKGVVTSKKVTSAIVDNLFSSNFILGHYQVVVRLPAGVWQLEFWLPSTEEKAVEFELKM